MATVGSIVIGAIVNTSSAISSIEKLSKSLDKISKTGMKDVGAGAKNVGDGLGQMSLGAANAIRGLATGKLGAIKDGLGKVAEGASKATGGFRQLGIGLAKLSLGVVASGLRGVGGILQQMPSFLNSVLVKAVGLTVAFGALALASGRSIDKAGDMADQLGTTTAELQKLRYAATLTGSSAESMDAALAKMNANLGDAATKGGPAADALKKIGLDPTQLVGIDPTAAFEAIAGGLREIPTPAARAAAALDIFGKGGAQVLTTIQAGPGEIQRLGAEFESFGGTVSESSRQSVGAMFDAFDKIGAIIGAFGGKIAVAAAPYVVALGDAFVSLAQSGQSIGVISPVLDMVATGVEYVGHAIDFAQLGWLGFKSNGLSALSAIAKGFASLGEGVASVLNLIPGMEVSLGTTARAMADELDRLAADAHNQGQRLLAGVGFGDTLRANFDKVRAGAAGLGPAIDPATASMKRMAAATDEVGGKIGDLVAKLTEERDTFGMSSTAAEIYKLKKAGATEETIKSAQAIADEVEALKARQERSDKQFADAQSIFDATRTPLEKFQAELSKLENLKATGLLDPATIARGAEKAKADFLGNTPQRGAALELGSQEARKAILDFRGQSSRDKPLQDVAASTKESAKQSAIQSALLTKLLDSFGKLTTNADPVF